MNTGEECATIQLLFREPGQAQEFRISAAIMTIVNRQHIYARNCTPTLRNELYPMNRSQGVVRATAHFQEMTLIPE